MVTETSFKMLPFFIDFSSLRPHVSLPYCRAGFTILLRTLSLYLFPRAHSKTQSFNILRF
jgi:hypothetical protein